MRRQNRQTGEFEYIVDLPSDIDANRVEANYNNGVLMVSVGKTQDTQPRRIEIQGKEGQRARTGQQGRQGQAGTTGQGGQTGQAGQPGQGGQSGQPGQRSTQQGERSTQQGERR